MSLCWPRLTLSVPERIPNCVPGLSGLGSRSLEGRKGPILPAVAFDGLQAARARKRDVLIVDTAGRLQSKQNLMQELAKNPTSARARGRERIAESLLRSRCHRRTERYFAGAGIRSRRGPHRHCSQQARRHGTRWDRRCRGARVWSACEVRRRGGGIGDLVPFDPDEFVSELLADA